MSNHDDHDDNPDAADYDDGARWVWDRSTLLAKVWAHAGDCWCLESTERNPTYAQGSPYESVTLAAGDLWRDGHARGLILDCYADPVLLAAALDISQKMRTALSRPRYWPEIVGGYLHDPLRPRTVAPRYLPRYAVWSLAVDLCRRALHITRQAGADTNPGDRARLLAGLGHHLRMTRHGGLISHHKHRNGQALPAQLARIDREHPPEDGEQEEPDDR